jgi:hypothetical protein
MCVGRRHPVLRNYRNRKQKYKTQTAGKARKRCHRIHDIPDVEVVKAIQKKGDRQPNSNTGYGVGRPSFLPRQPARDTVNNRYLIRHSICPA